MNAYNSLLNLIFIIIGIYFIYRAYKKPDPIVSFNEKGYVAGGAFILIGVLSFFRAIQFIGNYETLVYKMTNPCGSCLLLHLTKQTHEPKSKYHSNLGPTGAKVS